jgi:GNAT superfamily N-acetyltransferase
MTAADAPQGWQLRDLPPGDPAWDTGAFEVLRELRDHLDRAAFDAVHTAGRAQGLTFTAAFDTDDRCVGVAGWRVVHTTHVLRKLYVDDLVTSGAQRSRGVGAALLAHLAERGRAAGCHVLDLDSGHQRRDAHRFYLREGMTDVSRHFARSLHHRDV